MSELGDIFRMALKNRASDDTRSGKLALNSLAAWAYGNPELEAIYREWRDHS